MVSRPREKDMRGVRAPRPASLMSGGRHISGVRAELGGRPPTPRAVEGAPRTPRDSRKTPVDHRSHRKHDGAWVLPQPPSQSERDGQQGASPRRRLVWARRHRVGCPLARIPCVYGPYSGGGRASRPSQTPPDIRNSNRIRSCARDAVRPHLAPPGHEVFNSSFSLHFRRSVGRRRLKNRFDPVEALTSGGRFDLNNTVVQAEVRLRGQRPVWEGLPDSVGQGSVPWGKGPSSEGVACSSGAVEVSDGRDAERVKERRHWSWRDPGVTGVANFATRRGRL